MIRHFLRLLTTPCHLMLYNKVSVFSMRPLFSESVFNFIKFSTAVTRYFRATKEADPQPEWKLFCPPHTDLCPALSSLLPSSQYFYWGRLIYSSGAHGRKTITISRHSWTKTNSFHTAVAGNQTVLHALLICNYLSPLPFLFFHS